MNAANLIGQTLDEKYKIERELGRGGMGAVYLATHVGTERAVAVKVIAPEFMRRREFVERFRREARAAGRLRHPNVVDVTDFGLAETDLGCVAYLVMEYLDGCTLGEVLQEEKRLPLSWTLDILEQTCSAVEEAHRQGIIHRDLKPDNIWLEPNSRGGYTVKVLDFGIAKLEEPLSNADCGLRIADLNGESRTEDFTSEIKTEDFVSENQTLAFPANEENGTLAFSPNQTADFDENATLNLEIGNGQFAFRNQEAARPTIAENGATNQEAVATQILAPTAINDKKTIGNNTNAALTRVGAVLGTLLYMSPEQCRGEHLDARADVYSLGVIAYQMLAGSPPFNGDFTHVIKAHQNDSPPPLEAKKVRRKVKKVIVSALAKNADQRPASAIDFSSKLRASSEGVGTLLQRALVIYTEHLPTFVGLAFLLQLPMFLFTIARITLNFLGSEDTAASILAQALGAILGFAGVFIGIFFASILLGVTTWIVAQLLAVPLRPVNWKTALEAAGKKWRRFAGTVTITTALNFAGFIAALIPGVILLVLSVKISSNPVVTGVLALFGFLVLIAGLVCGTGLFVSLYLVSPVVMMENLRGRAALKRSAQLARRSLGTATAAFFLSFLVPVIMSSILAVFVNSLVKSTNETFVLQRNAAGYSISLREDSKKADENIEENREENLNEPAAAKQNPAPETEQEKRAKKSLKSWLFEAIFQTLWFPLLVLLSSLTSVITGLLYLKTRQAGGEVLGELLTEFEENDRTQKRWQLRLKDKLVQSGRHPGRNTKKSGEPGESIANESR